MQKLSVACTNFHMRRNLGVRNSIITTLVATTSLPGANLSEEMACRLDERMVLHEE
jgi:hypothetical protein